MSEEKLPESLVRENLYNWLGFGNLNGRYWFIGREEYDSIRKCQKLDSLREYYEVRRTFDFAEDFVETWEQSYGRSVEAGTSSMTTRHYQAAFLMAFNGVSPSGRHSETGMSKTSSFLFSEKRFGRGGGNHFSGELYPLRYHPDNPSTFDPYRRVWANPREYETEVRPQRLGILEEQLWANPNVTVVVSYVETAEFAEPFTARFDSNLLGSFPANKRNSFEVFECRLDAERNVFLVDSPFFGQGHVSYENIMELATMINRRIDG